MEEWENRWQMAFHPEKCVVIRVSNKRKPINTRYTILSRLVGCFLSSMGPMLSRHIPRLVLLVLDMLLLWLRICNLSYYVLGNPVFYQLQWETLQVRRVKIRLVLLYKIQQGLVAIPAETYLVPGDTRTRGEHKFRPPNVCTIKTKTWLLYIYIVWTLSWYPVSVSSWFLKPSSEVARATCGGSLFQSPMVRWNSGNIQQVEKVQRRAARFVTRNYHDRHPGSVTQMVQQLQWETLQVRRVKIRLVLLYRAYCIFT
jgi:hypothetical protein